MKKIILLFFVFICLIATANADWYGHGTNITLAEGNVTYTFIENVSMTSLTVNNTCMVIVGGDYAGTYCDSSHVDLILFFPFPQLTQCNDGNLTAINFSVYDSDTDAILNSTMAGHFTVYYTTQGYTTSNYNEFNFTWTAENYHGICLYPSYVTAIIDAEIEYTAPTYNTHSYFYDDASISNSTPDVKLYLMNGTSLVTFIVSDEDDDPIENLLIQVHEFDITTNTTKLTEVIRTDINGEAVGHIVLNTQRYKFILVYNGMIVLETDTDVILTLLTYYFRVNLQDSIFDTYDTILGVKTALTFTNLTKDFEYTFSNPSGSSTTACLKVKKMSAMLNQELCYTCITSSSGSVTFNIGADRGNFTYVATGSIIHNDEEYPTDIVSFSYDDRYKLYGESGIFLTFILTVFFVMVGLFNPVVAIFLMLFAFVLTNVLGFFQLSLPYLFTIIILGGITIFKLSKK